MTLDLYDTEILTHVFRQQIGVSLWTISGGSQVFYPTKTVALRAVKLLFPNEDPEYRATRVRQVNFIKEDF